MTVGPTKSTRSNLDSDSLRAAKDRGSLLNTVRKANPTGNTRAAKLGTALLNGLPELVGVAKLARKAILKV